MNKNGVFFAFSLKIGGIEVKRYLTLILILVLVMSLVPGAWAEEVVTLTVAVNNTDGGSVKISYGGVVQEGNSASCYLREDTPEKFTVTATPKEGYEFDRWTSDTLNGSYTDPQISIDMYADRTITANFKKKQCTLFVLTDGRGTVFPSEVTRDRGSKCSVEAFPAPGYEFYYWSENGETIKNYNNPLDFDMYADRTITANFKESGTRYNLNCRVYPENSGTVSPDRGSFSLNAPITVTAKPNEGFIFDCWTINGNNGGTNPSYTVTMNTDYELVAHFKTVPSPAQYSVTASVEPAGGGTVRGTDSYDAGRSVRLTATPNPGYYFVKWTNSSGSTLSEASDFLLSSSINENYAVKAIFAENYTSHNKITYFLNGGTLDSQVSNPQYYQYSITTGFSLPGPSLVSRSGYTFGGWYKDPYFTGAPVSGICPGESGEKVFYAKWIPIDTVKYVTVSNSNHGAVYTGNSRVTSGTTFAVRPGESVTFRFYPENLYYVYNVKINGSNLGSRDSYTFDYYSMTGDKNMYVTFGSVYGNPKTGDDSNLFLWSALSIGALACGVVVFASVRKKREE